MTGDRTKRTAHALLDMIAVGDFANATSESELAATKVAIKTAFERLNSIDAVTATRDDETEITTLELGPLLAGTGLLISMLLTWVAERGPYDRTDVIVAMRRVIDDLQLEDPEAPPVDE